MTIRTADEHDPCFEKLLSPNRDDYFAQSAATTYGNVAELPNRRSRVIAYIFDTFSPRLAAKVMRGRVG
jgi:hypothetical protein